MERKMLERGCLPRLQPRFTMRTVWTGRRNCQMLADVTTVRISLLPRLFRCLWRQSASVRRPLALLIAQDATTSRELDTILRDAGWELLVVNTLNAAFDVQKHRQCPVVLYDRYSHQQWREAITRLSNSSPHPCVILLAPRNDKNLRDEVAGCGGADVLRMPAAPDAILKAVEFHLGIWRTQQMLRRRARQAPLSDEAFPHSIED
jgi:DNA-binding NtrC family response regulator